MKKNSQGFLARKNIVISARRYGIDALGAMAQGLFASLLIGTILNTLGTQLGIQPLVDVGGFASSMSGAAMAVAIGYALQAPPLVLFSLVTVGTAANQMGGAGGPLAVLFIAIIASELGKAVSKETRIDILVTPLVTILSGVGLASLVAPAIGKAASSVGAIIMWATDLQPFLMGIIVSVIVGIALTLPISSAAICAALGLTGLAGHIDAADGQYCQKSLYLDPSHPVRRCHRPCRDLPVPSPDEWQSRVLRNGHLRARRTDRSLCGLGRRCCRRDEGGHHRHGLDRPHPDLLYPACHPHPAVRRPVQKSRSHQRW